MKPTRELILMNSMTERLNNRSMNLVKTKSNYITINYMSQSDYQKCGEYGTVTTDVNCFHLGTKGILLKHPVRC